MGSETPERGKTPQKLGSKPIKEANPLRKWVQIPRKWTKPLRK